MTRRRWFSLFLAALLLLSSCAPKEPPAPSSESISPPASVPAPAPNLEEQAAPGENYRDPSWYLSEETLSLLEKQGVSVSVEEMSPLKNRTFTMSLTFSDKSGSVSFPVRVKLDPDNGLEWGGISAGKDWFAFYNYYDLNICHSGKLDQPPLKLDTSTLSRKNKNSIFLGVAYSVQMGWVAPMLLDGKDAFGFFREDGSLEEAIELKEQESIFADQYVSGADVYVTRFREVKNLSPVPLEDGYVLFQRSSSFYIFSRATGELFLCDQLIRQKQDRATISLYRFDGLFSGRFPQNDHIALCIWDEKDGRSFSFFTGGVANLHPCFGWNEDFACDWSPDDHRITVFGEDTRVHLTMDFEAKKLEWEYLLRLEDLDQRYFEDPSYRSPDGRYILAGAGQGGAGDVAYWLETLYDTQTGEIRIVTISGGMYGGQEIVSFVDEDRLWVHDYDGVQLYRIDGLEPLPLPFPLELGEAYLFGLGYDQRAGQYAVLYENVTDEESGFYYSRNSTDTYRLAVYSENGTQLMDFDTGIPLQSGMGGLSRFSLAVEDGVVTFGNYDRFYDYDTSKSYTCRILLDTQTVERKDL